MSGVDAMIVHVMRRRVVRVMHVVRVGVTDYRRRVESVTGNGTTDATGATAATGVDVAAVESGAVFSNDAAAGGAADATATADDAAAEEVERG